MSTRQPIRRTFRWVRETEGSIYVLATALTIVLVAFATRIWHADWDIPFYEAGDASLIAAHFKTVFETGWFETQSLLGAPAGQSYFDWKVADNLQFVWANVLGHIFGNPFVAENVYYILGFPLAALSAVWFLRTINVSRWLTVVLAALFAIAPYHFIRNEEHFWFAEYYAVPLLLVLVYRVISSQPMWGIRPGVGRVRGILTGRGAATVVCAVIGASAETYYAFFSVLLLGTAGLIALARTRNWLRFRGAVFGGLTIVAVVVGNETPDFIYTLLHGSNAQAVVRSPLGSYLYSFRLTDLLLPVPDNRIPALAALRSQYEVIFGNAEEPALGFVAGVGLLVALVYGIYRIAVGRKVALDSTRPQFADSTDLKLQPASYTLGNLSALAIVALLISTAGGLGLFVGLFISDLRGWNRMSILLALFCLGIVGVLVDQLVVWLAARKGRLSGRGGALSMGIAVVLLVIGFVDQAPPALAVPPYASTKLAFEADAHMVARIQQQVPTHASILQLPYHRFPETDPVNGVGNTEQLIPYLHSKTLRWSGGGIKGRPLIEWQATLADFSTQKMTVAAAASGFAGILVDTQEEGSNAPTVLDGLTRQLGSPSVTAEHGRYVFFSLSRAHALLDSTYSAAERKQIGERTTQAVYVYDQPDYARDGYNLIPALIEGDKPSIVLDNASKRTVRLRVSFTMQFQSAAEGMILHLPSGDKHFTASLTPVTVTFTVEAPPGKTTLPITRASGLPFGRSNAIPGARGGSVVQFSDVTAEDLTLKSLLSQLAK
jgi:hypothetical protein